MFKKIFLCFQNLILIGMPDSGKTYLGQSIAKTYSLPFYDMDDFTKSFLPNSLNHYHRDWYRYRHQEYETIKNLLGMNHSKIISTGGGFIEYAPNYQLLLNINRTENPVYHIIKQHSYEKENRPLPNSWENLWIKRGKYYFQLSDDDYWNNGNMTQFYEWINTKI